MSELVKKNPYQRWIESQEIPIHRGFAMPNLAQVEVGRWPRLGAKGAFIQLEGTGDLNDAYVLEIDPGGKCEPERHLYEEFVYVLNGRGATTVWQPDGAKRIFEWHQGSLFSVPLNAWHQHFNGDGEEVVRFYVVTSAPVVISLFQNLEFVFGSEYIFRERFDGREDFFTAEGTEGAERSWDTNLIEDVRTFPLLTWRERGGSGTNRFFYMSGSSMSAHISEFAVGRYKKAHRHGPGANVMAVSGEGYSLLWLPGHEDERVKVPWSHGTVLVPPDGWFHQHFNVGPTPARYTAIHSYKSNHRWKQSVGDKSLKEGGAQIEYEDEDPAILEMFREELRKRNVECQMPPR